MEAVDDGALLVKERPVAWRPTNNCVQCSFIWVALSTHDLVFTIGVLCVVHVGSHLLQNPTPNFSSPSPSFITLAPLIHVTFILITSPPPRPGDYLITSRACYK
ncbi:hypothetical protein XPA_001456 [Xanthoria parietina]